MSTLEVDHSSLDVVASWFGQTLPKKKKKWRCRRQVGVVILTINLYSVCMCGKGKKTEKKEKKTSLKKRIPWRKNKVIFPPRYTLFCFFFYTSPCGGWGGWWWWWWTVSLQPDKQRLEFWNRSIIFNCFSFLHLSCRMMYSHCISG